MGRQSVHQKVQSFLVFPPVLSSSLAFLKASRLHFQIKDRPILPESIYLTFRSGLGRASRSEDLPGGFFRSLPPSAKSNFLAVMLTDGTTN